MNSITKLSTYMLLVGSLSALHKDYETTEPLATITHTCTMRVHIDGEDMGDLVFGMYGGLTPKSNDNFEAMCNQSSGALTKEGKPLVYAGTCVNTVIPGQMIQAGNVKEDSTAGGDSIYGGKFDDENFLV